MPIISCNNFAKLAKIRRETASRLLKSFYNGRTKPWNGSILNVQISNGKGGNSGKGYYVLINSLPKTLKTTLNNAQKASEASWKPLGRISSSNKQENWWIRILSPLIQPDITKQERSLLIDGLCNQNLTDWNGNPKKLSRSIIYSRLKKLKEEGIGSQTRKGRSDQGNRRVYISKIWDDNVPFDDETKELISSAVTKQIQGYVKQGTQTSKTEFFINDYLIQQTANHGYRPNEAEILKEICKVPRYKIQEQKKFKNVHRFKTDKKEHYDASPSIQRDWSNCAPMECVVADVHHLNFIIKRENNTHATAKMIAFQDMATQRIWSGLIFFEEKAGVRNTDVIEVFAGMLANPSWGVPKTLYVDNGSEYLFTDYLADLLQLVYPTTNLKNGENSNHIIRAIPYNGKAKPVEARFGHLEQHYFQHIDGYIGDDRMNPKTPKLGKLPTAVKGFTEAIKQYDAMMDAYHHFPQKSFLNSLSPMQKFNEFVETGWAATIVNTDDLNAAISKPVTKKVHSDFVKIKNIQFQADELARFSGERVIVHIPSYTDFISVRVETSKGDFICNATAEKAYKYDDREGAIRSSDRKRNFNKSLREMDKETPNPNVKEALHNIAKKCLPVVPNAPNGEVALFGDEPAPQSPNNDNVVPIRNHTQNNQTEIEINRKFLPDFNWRE